MTFICARWIDKNLGGNMLANLGPSFGDGGGNEPANFLVVGDVLGLAAGADRRVVPVIVSDGMVLILRGVLVWCREVVAVCIIVDILPVCAKTQV